jgi:hypothetical protein
MHQFSMILFAAACLLSAQGAPGFKVEGERERLAGVWAFKTDAGPTRLTGTVSVWRDGEVYVVQWSGRGVTADGAKVTVQLAGVGLLTDGLFSISWSDGKGHGLSVFRVDGKSARGRWCPGSGARVVEEVWTFVAAHKE